MHDDLYDKINNDEGLIKWLRYGFTWLTGIVDDSAPRILTYLRSVKRMSDEDILRLTTQNYPVSHFSYSS